MSRFRRLSCSDTIPKLAAQPVRFKVIGKVEWAMNYKAHSMHSEIVLIHLEYAAAFINQYKEERERNLCDVANVAKTLSQLGSAR